MKASSKNFCLPSAPAAEAVRAQLDKILASKHFCNSDLLGRFLVYVVDHSLNEDASPIKEYRLGVEVFGRSPSYDPRTDPVVRLTARRLRAKLEAYYQFEGQLDLVRIDVPKGSYAASFSTNPAPSAPPIDAGHTNRLATEADCKPASVVGRRQRASAVVFALMAAIPILALAFGIDWWLFRKTALPFQNVSIRKVTSAGNAELAAISPDGKYILSVVDQKGMVSLWLRHVPTNSDAQIVPSAQVHYLGLRFGVQGNYVYFVRNESENQAMYSLFRVPLLGGGEQKIVTDIDSNITFAPDDDAFAYIVYNNPVNGQYRLIIQSLESGEQKTLATGSFNSPLFDPAWSPDGKTIVCSARQPGDSLGGLVAIDVRTGKQTLFFVSNTTQLAHPVWLPNETGLLTLASDSSSNFTSQQITFISFPQGNARAVTHDASDYGDISLTADGRTAVAATRDAHWRLFMVSAADVAKGQPRQVSSTANIDSFSWTPSGQLIVSQEFALSFLHPDSGEIIPLLRNEGGFPRQPSACHDGRHIVLVLSGGKHSQSVWRMDVDGSNLRQLTQGKLDQYPECSPNGQSAFYEDVTSKERLRRVPLWSGGPSELVTHQFMAYPRFFAMSPDGTQSAFSTFLPSDPKEKLALVETESGQLVKMLAFEREPQGGLRFDHEGKAVIYAIRTGNADNLWLQPTDGSPGKQITNFNSDFIRDFRWSFDGTNLALLRGRIDSDVVVIRDSDRQ